MAKHTTKTIEKQPVRRRFSGVVVSTSENKTIHVLVQNRKTDSKYRKQYWESKKYAVHDEEDNASVGDMVVFEECRPLSKTKRWRMIRIEHSAA